VLRTEAQSDVVVESRIPEEAMAAHSGLSFLVQAFPAVAFIAATTTSPMALVGFALLAFGLG